MNDVLTISGTNAADQITVDFTALDSVVVDLGDSNGTRRFASGSFHAAAVDLRCGRRPVPDDLRWVSRRRTDHGRTGNGNDVVGRRTATTS